MYDIISDFERPDPALIERARDIYFCLAGCRVGPRYVMDPGIQALDLSMRMCGPAMTVRPEYTDDLLMGQLAGKYVRPGDVVVIDAGGDTRLAAWGASMSAGVKQMGAEGVVVDGYVLTAEVIRARENIPVFCRGTKSLSGASNKPGWINVPVICGGVIVNPGDLICGDQDGVVVIPRARIAEVLDDVAGDNRARARDGSIEERKPMEVPYYKSTKAEAKLAAVAGDSKRPVRFR